MKRSTFNIQHSTFNAWPLRKLTAVAMLTICSWSAFAQSTNVPATAQAKLTYDSFRTISDRNIFNPSRYARGSGKTTQRTASTPASRVESFSLVGIMAYDKGVFAFFDGTKGDYKKALQSDGDIGDFKVVRVASTETQLASGTNTFDLKVGMQMRREDEGEWFLSEGGDSAKRRIVSTRTRTRSGSHGETVPGNSGDDMAALGEPEVIVIESDPQAATSESETHPANGDATSHTSESSSTGNPVLDRLMRQAEALRNQ